MLRTGIQNLAWLAADDPERARREVDEARRFWSRDGFQVPHFLQLFADTQIDLYTGTKPLKWKILGSGTKHSKSVAAYVVTDPKVVKPLKSAHIASAQSAMAD